MTERLERIGKIILISPNFKTNNVKSTSIVNEEATIENEDVDKILNIPHELYDRLFSHQKYGVRWLYGLYSERSGGILGDDMGLGKTFQVTVFLTCMMRSKSISRVLIVAPVSVLESWKRELHQHLLPHIPKGNGLQIDVASAEMTKKKRISTLRSVFVSNQQQRIVISSYHLVANMTTEFATLGEWDYVILDEGHIIKNPRTKISKAMHQTRSPHRLILTGTPIQNNLAEFYSLIDWVTQGRLLGSLSNFTARFSNPITTGQDPRANDVQRKVAGEAASALMTLTKKILLQRKKCEQPSEALKLPLKTEVVVWVPLSTEQRTIYQEFMESKTFKYAMIRSTYPVEIINHLKTLCRHPFLLEASSVNMRRKAQLQKKSTLVDESDNADTVDNLIDDLDAMNISDKPPPSSGMDKENMIEDCDFDNVRPNASIFEIAGRDPDTYELMKGSVKLRVLVKLVGRFHRRGHRTLVFSQSRLMLDIIQRSLAENSMATHRIDGSVTPKDRQKIIDEFNDLSEDNMGPTICLLTTKACGCGITLTGADRVVIFDPSWNPAEDRQAVDRAYRIGQMKNVVVYRMIMAATVEEKIYEKQVFKDGLRVVTESGSSSRYFSSKETTDLFKLGLPGKSVVMEKLWELAGSEFKTFDDTYGDLPSVLGFSRHDTLYREARPKELQSQSESSSTVNLQVSFPASKASAVVRKESIRDHFPMSQENSLSDNGDRRNPPTAGTKKAIEVISLLSSDDSSSDDGEIETDDNDLLAERLQSLTLQPTASPSDSGMNYCAETVREGKCSPEPEEIGMERKDSLTEESPSAKQISQGKLCSTPILFEEGGEGEDEFEERSPGIDDVQNPFSDNNITLTPLPKQSPVSEHGDAGTAEASAEGQDISARVGTTPILFDDGDMENERDCSASSLSEVDAPRFLSEKAVSLSDRHGNRSTTPILCDDEEKEYNQSQSGFQGSSTPATASPICPTSGSADRHSATPLLFENDEEAEHEKIEQEYSDSSLGCNDVHDRFALQGKEYEPDDEEYLESIAQLDSSECENSCWIPELVEIQSLLQNVHEKLSSQKNNEAALPPSSDGHVPRTDQHQDEVVEAASNTIAPGNELGAGNRRRSSVDRFLNNCAQPDLFFSPPALRNDCPPDSCMQHSGDSRISLPSYINYPTVVKRLEPGGREGVHREASPEYLPQQNIRDTPSEAVSRVIVHTMSKPAMPFICVSSDSEASTVSSHSSSRDSILSVDHMADRLGTGYCMSPEVVAEDSAASPDRANIISENNRIERETSAKEFLGEILDSVELVELSDAPQEHTFNSTDSKSDAAAYLNDQTSFESPCSISISSTDAKFSNSSSIPQSKRSFDDKKDTFSDTQTQNKDAMLEIDIASEETKCKSFGTFPQPTVAPSETAVDVVTPVRSLGEHDIPDALLSYSHLQNVVVEPIHLSIDDTIETAAVLVASRNRNMLSSLRSHGVVWDDDLIPLKPVECLTAEDIRLYNECIIEANAQDDMLQAAVLFMQALSICDSDMKLHSKLAWICDTLKKQPNII